MVVAGIQASRETDERDRGQWVALKTRAQHEKAVRDRLHRLGFEHLLPILPRVSQWHDRKKVIEAPLFPGYCFARLSVHNRSTVVQLPGVAYIVGRAGFSDVIPDEEVDALKRLTKSGMPYESAMCLSEGDLVEIIRGPLAGVRGNLVRRERSHCVIIGVQLLQQGATVKIDAEDVRRLEEPAGIIGSGSFGRRAEPQCVVAAR
jgi:transcription antitermination factor NusG